MICLRRLCRRIIHVSPLVDMLLPLSVQEFFVCFISDDQQFNTKVTRFANRFCASLTLRVKNLVLRHVHRTSCRSLLVNYEN